MSSPVTIVDFLKARVAEDRQQVLSSGPAKLGWGTYLHPDGGMGYTSPVASRGLSDEEWVTAGKVTHPDVVAVVFDPETRLADIDSKLRIVNHLAGVLAERVPDEDIPRSFVRAAHTDALYTLRLLALPFTGHSQYQEGWKP